MESLPEWIFEWINNYHEECRRAPSFCFHSYVLIAKGEWNEQMVYFISGGVFMADLGHICNEAGDRIANLWIQNIFYDNDGGRVDFSSSKNWVVIHELGDVPYLRYM